MESLLATIAILWLATLFAYSGSLKLVDYQASLAAASGYRLLPDSLARGVGAVLPWVELAACGFLLVPATRTAGAAIAAGLGAMFAVASATALVRRLDVSCGCAGQNSRVNRITLIRSLTIVAGASGAIALSPDANTVVAVGAVALALVPAAVALLHRLAYRMTHARHEGRDHHHRHRPHVSDTEVATLTALIARPASGPAAVTLPVVVQENA